LTAAVAFERVGKRFPGVVALEGVSFEVARGSAHALCGENGAGKSTLGRILAGVHAPDEGRVLLDGRAVRFRQPGEALGAGIGMVHQEPAFCDGLTVAENLCLGALPARAGFVSFAEAERRARSMLADVAPEIDARAALAGLGVGERQMVQIASAVGQGARVIVFDEPTSRLTSHESARLHALVRRLLGRGVAVLYVSHRLEEVFELCDTVTVLRDGRHVLTRPARELTESALVEAMIGRPLDEYFPRHLARAAGEVRLAVEHLASPGRFSGISFLLRAGEVVGLAGLVGSGRSQVAQALFGLDPRATGRVLLDGRPLPLGDPALALARGLGYLPEDRQRQGLVIELSVRENTTLPILKRLARLGFVDRAAERELARAQSERLRVKAPGLEAAVAGLSGGNQQKVVLAKWLAARCRVLLLDEPTRGVDVGAKAEIHALVDALAAEGNAVLLISSELAEIVRLSRRVLVLREGRLAGELEGAAVTQEAALRLMHRSFARPQECPSE
jgi:ABC-type sugar transport system ATPase subunit